MENIRKYFEEKAIKNNIPYQVQIDLTNKCNCNCIFCFEGNEHKNFSTPLSIDEIKKLLNELKTLGTYSTGYSGGEPFCREDTMEILEYTRYLGFATTIVTNGHLLTKNDLVKLSKLNLRRITFSFHSHDMDNYNYHFGINNISPTDILEKITMLKKLGANVGVAATVTKHNIKDLKQMYKLLLDNDINHISFNMLTPGKKEINLLLPSTESIENTVKDFPELATKYLQNKNSSKSFLCSAGRISATVTYNGDIYACPFSNKNLGNLRKSSFKQIWFESDYLNFIRDAKESKFETCFKCKNKNICNMCLVRNENYSGSMFEPNKNFCELITKFSKVL